MDMYYNIYGYLLDLTISVHQKFELLLNLLGLFLLYNVWSFHWEDSKAGAEIIWSCGHSGILILMLAIG